MKIFYLLTLISLHVHAKAWRDEYHSFKSEFELLTPMEGCLSKEGEPILMYDRPGKSDGKRILVLSLIHGNELPAGVVGFRWIRRLQKISPHNSWKVLPVVNPDGVKAVTRTNANKIDLNRHFPTKDWDAEAINYWKKHGAQPQKFPGDKAASEPEVQCLVKLIDNYKPDLIVSLHTPFSVLDYDGDKRQPKYKPMLWKSLGNYPGSLGRYAWAERGIPVLTVEMPQALPHALEAKMDRFQDELSYLAK